MLQSRWHRHTSAAAVVPPDHMATDHTARLAVVVSGGGSNFKAIHAACLDGRINAEIVVCTANK